MVDDGRNLPPRCPFSDGSWPNGGSEAADGQLRVGPGIFGLALHRRSRPVRRAGAGLPDAGETFRRPYRRTSPKDFGWDALGPVLSQQAGMNVPIHRRNCLKRSFLPGSQRRAPGFHPQRRQKTPYLEADEVGSFCRGRWVESKVKILKISLNLCKQGLSHKPGMVGTGIANRWTDDQNT